MRNRVLILGGVARGRARRRRWVHRAREGGEPGAPRARGDGAGEAAAGDAATRPRDGGAGPQPPDRPGRDGASRRGVHRASNRRESGSWRSTRPARLASDLVTLAIGVRPETDLARDARLPLGPRGGILVDAQMRTADPATRRWATRRWTSANPTSSLPSTLPVHSTCRSRSCAGGMASCRGIVRSPSIARWDSGLLRGPLSSSSTILGQPIEERLLPRPRATAAPPPPARRAPSAAPEGQRGGDEGSRPPFQA
jgi:hypothetical protein